MYVRVRVWYYGLLDTEAVAHARVRLDVSREGVLPGSAPIVRR